MPGFSAIGETAIGEAPAGASDVSIIVADLLGLTQATTLSAVATELDLSAAFSLGLTQVSSFDLDLAAAAAVAVDMSTVLDVQFQHAQPALGVSMAASIIANEIDMTVTFGVGVGQALTFPGLVTLPSQDIRIAWLRRDRLAGSPRFVRDSVPMSEATESYDVEIILAGSVVRTFSAVTATNVVYTAAMQIEDGWTYPPIQLSVRVFQLSAVVGRGFGEIITVDVA